MELRSLNTFVQVAESGSFTRAGEILGYSQPTISTQIRHLEQELGVKLFDRIGHTVRLTQEGREVLGTAQRICQMCHDITMGKEFGGTVHGIVRMGMSDSLISALLKQGFSGFRMRYPHISIKIETAGTTELFRLLDHNEVDVLCTLDSRIYNTNYIVANEEKVGVHFVVPAGHPLSSATELTVSDLMVHPLLLTERGMSYRRILEEQLARESVELQPVLETGNADFICELVERGEGISFLPDYVTRAAVERGSVVRLNLKGFEPDLWKQLLYRRDKWLSAQMNAVISYFGSLLLKEL